MNLESMAAHLQAQGLGTIGKNLFAVEMPSTCNEGLLLLDEYSGTPIHPYLEGYYKTEFRLICRSVNFDKGAALIKKAVLAVRMGDLAYTAGSMNVQRAFPLNLPRKYRRSAGAYWEFEVDIDFVYVDTSA